MPELPEVETIRRQLASRLPGVQHPAGYAFYLMAGTLAWSLFQDTVIRPPERPCASTSSCLFLSDRSS